MLYHFSWVKKGTLFDEFIKEKKESSLQILSFALSHQEGEVAILKLDVAHFEHTTKTHLFFWGEVGDGEEVHKMLLFKGHLINIPFQNADRTWALELRADVDIPAFKEVCTQLKSHTDIFSFFHSGQDHLDPTTLLESTAGFFEFDRTQGICSLVPITEGKEKWTPSAVFKDSINVRVTHVPFKEMDVVVEAPFVQEDFGEVNISPLLLGAFPGNKISTYTPEHFKASFPRTGDKLGKRRGKSGCRVVESEILEVIPPSTGGLDVYPTTSPSLWVQNKEGEWREASLKRTWLNGRLVIEWIYTQPRREIAHFTLVHKDSALQIEPQKRRKKLKFVLSHIPKSKTHSFFKGAQGKRALEYAMEMARVHLQASSRCVEVTFEVPLSHAIFWTTMDSVDVSSILKKTTPIFGKIAGYQWIHKNGVGVCRVRVALCLSVLSPLNEVQRDYAEEYFCELYAHETHNLGTGGFEKNLHEYEPKGIVRTDFLHTTSIVRDVVVHNGPDEQERMMESREGDFDISGIEMLRQYPTTFEVRLQDLRTESTLIETIDLGTVYVERLIVM